MTDFSEALLCVKAGGTAYRAAWRDNGYTAVMRLVPAAGRMCAFIAMEFPDGRLALFAATQTDILADDWVTSNT